MGQVSKQAAKHKSLLDYKDLGQAFGALWSPAGGAGSWGEDPPPPPRMHTPLQTSNVRLTFCARKGMCLLKLTNLSGGEQVPHGRTAGGVPTVTSQLMDWPSGRQTTILRPP